MRFPRVKQLFHPFLCIFHRTLTTSMFNPVLGGVFGQREFAQAVSGDVFVQV
jgi:hypothetical protein